MWTTELSYVYPEIWLVTMTCFILTLVLFVSKHSKWIIYSLCQFTLLGTIFWILQNTDLKTTLVFNNMFTLDPMGSLLKLMICLIGFFVFLYSRQYVFERKIYRGEYYILSLFSIFGMMILISAKNFLSLYLGIELFALPLYALITIAKEDKVAPEAAIKYFVMGALASGMLLYGISLLYGVTGSFDMGEIATELFYQSAPTHPALLLGMVLIVVGLAFKFGAVPFHMWLPDVYQGAPICVTLFIGTLPKLAAFGFAIRIFSDTFQAFNTEWRQLLAIMAILSLAIGNIVAIAQVNLKRMLAYSTIAHIGFLFLGILAGPSVGYAAALDYVLIYVLMALGVFGVMTAFSYQGFEAENIQDFRGLSQRDPWAAFLMMIIFLSLAGIPPFAGFFAKLFVINALIMAGYAWLAVFAVLLTVIGAFYYLRVIRVMFFDVPIANNHYQPISRPGIAVLSLNGLTILALGIFPAPLLNVCTAVMSLPR